MKKIGMVVALQKEILPFLESLNVKIRKSNVGKFYVAEFEIYGKKIVCVNSGVGEIRAAAATQYLITAHKPDIVLNFGVCGSLSESLGLKTVVLVSGVVHYAFDTSEIDDCPPGKYDDYRDVIIDTDKVLLEKAKEVFGGVQTVVCASADKFVGTVSEKNRIRADFNADVCDMECAGVLITANANGVPALIVKAVSDGDGGANDYLTTVHEATRQYIDFLINFIKTIE